MTQVDYSKTGLTIAQAKIDQARNYSTREDIPDSIVWGDRYIKTSDWLTVPNSGIIRLEFINSTANITNIRQGIDIKCEEGGLRLPSGEEVPILRSWKDDRYEDVVRYPYVTKAGRICIWNVYEVKCRGDQTVAEKWTDNAGFWVEEVAKYGRIYHCSPGQVDSPDFSSLVFRIDIV